MEDSSVKTAAHGFAFRIPLHNNALCCLGCGAYAVEDLGISWLIMSTPDHFSERGTLKPECSCPRMQMVSYADIASNPALQMRYHELFRERTGYDIEAS